jgi:type IV fimbrial biogenesis protein FimT
MLMTRPRLPQAGVTLVELLIGVAIMGILLMLGLPEMRSWIADMQVKGAAQSVASGMQTARTEAIRRGTRVNFTLNTADAANGGWSWAVEMPNAAASAPAIRQGLAGDGGATTSLSLAGLPSTIAFSSLGRPVQSGSTASVCDATKNGTCYVAVSAPGAELKLRVLLERGGSVRVCDPSMAVAGDPRACPSGT